MRLRIVTPRGAVLEYEEAPTSSGSGEFVIETTCEDLDEDTGVRPALRGPGLVKCGPLSIERRRAAR